MWLFSTLGFYSVVAHNSDPDTVLVRARVREDLERLVVQHLPGALIIETPERDYRFRVIVAKDEWARTAGELADAIDYGNFKSAVGARQGSERAHVYSHVWSDVHTLQERA